MPESSLPAWNGAESSVPGVPGEDYQQACEVNEWIKAISVGNTQGLVLSGYPTSAAFTHKDDHLHIVRWLCAEAEKDLLDLFTSPTPPFAEEKAIEFTHFGGRLAMIDALHSGSEISYQPLMTELVAGKYSIETYTLKASDMELLVHRFRPAE